MEDHLSRGQLSFHILSRVRKTRLCKGQEYTCPGEALRRKELRTAKELKEESTSLALYTSARGRGNEMKLKHKAYVRSDRALSVWILLWEEREDIAGFSAEVTQSDLHWLTMCGNGLEWSKNQGEETGEEATANIQEERETEPRRTRDSRRNRAYFRGKSIKFADILKLGMTGKRTKTKGWHLGFWPKEWGRWWCDCMRWRCLGEESILWMKSEILF